MKPIKLVNELEVRLNHTSKSEFKEFLLKEIYKLYLKNGQNKPAAVEAATLATELYNNLQKTWPGVKIEWLQQAFGNGINGDYGDFANISYRSMNDWIKIFRYNMKRGDFAIAEEPMTCNERSEFILKNRGKLPSINQLEIRGKEALKRKLNKRTI